MNRSFMMHLGTIALGALVVALLQLARIMCEVFFRSMQTSDGDGGNN